MEAEKLPISGVSACMVEVDPSELRGGKHRPPGKLATGSRVDVFIEEKTGRIYFRVFGRGGRKRAFYLVGIDDA